MAEEAKPVTVSAEPEKMEESAAPSTSATPLESDDVDNEAKKLMGAGRRHMVMKDICEAVNCFQKASSILGNKYGETAEECADAFFAYGTALLELARVETNVLGNALEGMPEDKENGEKEEDPNIPSAADLDEKEREQLREQVYDAMAEKEEKGEQAKTEEKEKNGDVEMEEGDKQSEGKEGDKTSEDKEGTESKTNGDAAVVENGDKVEKKDEEKKEGAEAVTEDKAEESKAEDSKVEDKGAEEPKKDEVPAEPKADEGAAEVSKPEEKSTEESKAEEKSEPSEKTEAPAEEAATKDKTEGDAKPAEGDDAKTAAETGDEPMEGEEEGDSESEEGEENEGTEEKTGNDEDEVDNLQLAWEMLELSKLIYKRKDDKESQLKAAQTCLRLGEVGLESENYSQAIEDFLACLTIQKTHLEAHDRLLAETNCQLGLAYQYSNKHEEAITHFTQSIEVIEKRITMLEEQIEKAESKEELQKEMDELKGLLPDLKEKIEDSKEAQKSGDVTEALKDTLVGSSSGFGQENGSTSTSAVSKSPAEKNGDSTVPVTNCVSDISHLVRKKRKPEEESPLKEAKKCKAELVENGSSNGDAVVPTSEEAEKAEEADKEKQAEKEQTPMETTAMETATVEGTA